MVRAMSSALSDRSILSLRMQAALSLGEADAHAFWVSRMITFGLAVMGKKPFDTVYVHGLVRDSQGRLLFCHFKPLKG